MKGAHFSKEIMQLVLAKEVILQQQGITDQAATHETLVEDDVVVVVVLQVGQVPTSLIETSQQQISHTHRRENLMGPHRSCAAKTYIWLTWV